MLLKMNSPRPVKGSANAELAKCAAGSTAAGCRIQYRARVHWRNCRCPLEHLCPGVQVQSPDTAGRMHRSSVFCSRHKTTTGRGWPLAGRLGGAMGIHGGEACPASLLPCHRRQRPDMRRDAAGAGFRRQVTSLARRETRGSAARARAADARWRSTRWGCARAAPGLR